MEDGVHMRDYTYTPKGREHVRNYSSVLSSDNGCSGGSGRGGGSGGSDGVSQSGVIQNGGSKGVRQVVKVEWGNKLA